MQTLIVIVNYRTASLTIDCLESLAKQYRGCDETHVALVDNASGDDSVETLAAAIQANAWNDWVSLLPLDHNGGFAYGNNAAITDALARPETPEFIWLLNPDTVVRAGALEHLIRFLEEHPDAGLVGSRLEDPDETPQRSAFRFPSLLSELEDGLRFGPVSKLLWRHVIAPEVSDACIKTDWVAGASLLVRKQVFDEIGVLDQHYFMYYEEVDFCRQAANGGWSCWYEPASRVVHLVGQASGVTNAKTIAKRRPQYWFDSRRRYFVKNHGIAYAALVDLAWAFSYTTWRIRAKLQGKKSNEPPRFLRDFIRNSVLIQGGAA